MMRFSRRGSPARAMPLSALVRDRPAMLFATLALLAVVAILGRAAGGLLVQRRWSRESGGWPRARGEVLEARSAWSSSPRSGTAYWPVIRYRYAVGGTTFEADRVSFRARYARAEVERAIAEYPVGAAVAVRYRPGDPRTAVLEPGTWNGEERLRVLVPLGVAATVSTLVCAAFLVFVSRPRR
jgi:hypothetical protein